MSEKPQFIVLDTDNNPWGPFDSAAAAREWGNKTFPGVDWYDEGAQGGFIEIIALRDPADVQVVGAGQ